jgi:hypothetical protein
MRAPLSSTNAVIGVLFKNAARCARGAHVCDEAVHLRAWRATEDVRRMLVERR